MKGYELKWIVNKTHNEPFFPMSTSPKHLFIARFNISNDCMNKMALLLERNIGLYAERVTRVRVACVVGPTDMNFPAVAKTVILKLGDLIFGKPKMDKTKNELVWYLSVPTF